MLRGEGEAAIVLLLEAAGHGRSALEQVPGAVTLDGEGPPPIFVQHLDDLLPARDLLRHRRKYYIGQLDPCASIEFSRGCPWDCTFCSAWTFYGRSYRMKTPERAVEEIEQIREPGLFILDDVAFIQAEHGMAIGEAIARKGIQKQYWLETRADVLLRNKEVFQLWSRIGLKIMFIGIEAIDEEGLKKFRKRVSSVKNFEALEFARKHGRQRRDQHHRRPRLGSRALPGHPRVVPGDPRDRERQRQHALSRDRDVGDGGRASWRPATTGSSTSSTRCSPRSCRWPSSTRSWCGRSRC